MGKSRHVVILGLVIVCVITMFPGSAGAVIYEEKYSGSLTGGAGLTVYDGWSGATLSWNVLWNTDQERWRYEYTLSNLGQKDDVSHFLIETSNSFGIENLQEWKDGTVPPVVYTWTPGDGGSNPYLPSDLYGIKFDTDGYADTTSVWFETDRSPVWGDWYAKDGVEKEEGSQEWAVAYNKGFGTTVGELGENWNLPASTANGVPTGWTLNSTGDYAWNYVLTPDTVISDDPGGGGYEVPEPNIGLLLLLGIIPVGIGVRRRRARKQS